MLILEKLQIRTVITFVGEAEIIVDAAFKLISKAKELIDMSISFKVSIREWEL